MAIWNNVISTPGSAREARTQFETGYGDALIDLRARRTDDETGRRADIDMVVPKATIFSEHPAVMIDRKPDGRKTPGRRGLHQLSLDRRGSTGVCQISFPLGDERLVQPGKHRICKDRDAVHVDMFGGWDKAYPDVIEGIFINQVKTK